MDKLLNDVLTGKCENYLFPFYWQQGNHYDKITEQIKRIYDSGARAVCVESRTHPEFAGDGWWRDMQRIIDECEKRKMKVWILDDSHFPTGYANGLIGKKYPERRKWALYEHRIDVIGPAKDASVALNTIDPQSVIGIFMYRRTGESLEVAEECIELTDNFENGILYFDVPNGKFRIYVLYKAQRTDNDYIDMISPVSCDTLIEAVYEPHYEHFSKYFGNTIAGFFSDEPEFGNDYFYWKVENGGFFNCSIGSVGLGLPYSDELLSMMSDELGFDARRVLPALWFEIENVTPKARLSYMNAATRLYKRNFSEKMGNWCRNHGVEYIGHIIEDNNAHARLGCSVGHYFRAMSGQDMSGMDLVYQQVMPGFYNALHAHRGSGSCGDSEFFHYSIAQMCASAAHLDPKKHNRAMCEIFGAIGWGEDSAMMKWLIDFCLVRGINHFVPHAFSPSFPNNDCPPHFGAEGHDPQFDAFCALMHYTNKACHLLSDGVHIANAAVVYHAEGEWASRDDYMYMQKINRVLIENHIALDILPKDTLMNEDGVTSAKDGKLYVNQEKFDCIFVPFTHYLDDKFLSKLFEYKQSGIGVAFANALPDNCKYDFDVVPVSDCAKWFYDRYTADLTVEGNYEYLRHYHIRRENADVYMFFNESVNDTVDTNVNIGKNGKIMRLDMLNDYRTTEQTDGRIHLHLTPYQSQIIVVGNVDGNIDNPVKYIGSDTLNAEYKISLSDYTDLDNYREYCVTDKLFNISGRNELPRFSGKIKYEFTAEFKKFDKIMLDFGNVGDNIRLFVNGQNCGIRISRPYCFDISDFVNDGENRLCAVVSNTLARSVKDDFSQFVQLRPSGITDNITVKYFRK